MHIVTITFNDDLLLCKYQLRSIKKFLPPCHIHVVINETDCEYAREYLKDEISKINFITVWDQKNVVKDIQLPSNRGWYTQQVLKLLFPLEIDYVVLDSKDIFVQPIDLESLKKEYDLFTKSELTMWRPFYKRLMSKLPPDYKKTANFKLVRNVLTPKTIKKEIKPFILKIWGDYEQFVKWFVLDNIGCNCSEFLLYDIMRLHENISFEKNWKYDEILWLRYPSHVKKTTFSELSKNTKIVKVHRHLLKDRKTKKRILRWFNTFLS